MKGNFRENTLLRKGCLVQQPKQVPCFRLKTKAVSVTETETEMENPRKSPPGISGTMRSFTETATAKIVVFVGNGSRSPFEGETWEEVMRHMSRRINWIDPGFELLVFTDTELSSTTETEISTESAQISSTNDVLTAVGEADILLAVEIQSEASVETVGRLMSQKKTSVYFGTNQELLAKCRLGDLAIGQLSVTERTAANLGIWPKGSESFKVLKLITESWSRENPDDVWFSILVLVNAYVTEVPMLQNLRAKDFSSLQCMVTNCRSQIFECLTDPECRKALDCLTSCGPTDQVCSYRCIVSYESPLLEAFSLCILQKHNCLNLNAEIRTRPEVEPLVSFRGEPLTHELAEDIFIGWLGTKEYSWRVVAGQNAAYDQFPCQYQIFYRGKGKGVMWYDPVFTVKTLDGKSIWRRRHYRVKRSELPGTFWFSVLDNGVTSKEFWTIVDVAEDFSWALFYYSGAAAAAGQSYTGAVLLSNDGIWPSEDKQLQLEAALERCGIKVWELYRVDNSDCRNPPLGLAEDIPTPVSIA